MLRTSCRGIRSQFAWPSHPVIPQRLELESNSSYSMCMKTTVDIPDGELEDAMRFTHARTKREAIVSVIAEFNQRRRMAELVKRAGTCSDLMSVDELRQSRRKG